MFAVKRNRVLQLGLCVGVEPDRLSARIHLHALEGVERISAIDLSRIDVVDAPDKLSTEGGIKLFIVLRGVKRSEQTGVQRQHLFW